ncbi:glycoside hydrolase family 95 protein [Gymnopus androsaceus JB14]|uniref:Glycoside hydrolase family 95 protein n=1 Tax=Gymnopus androsaceus JB14 TaxID=1447944 RepID=A0A6A4I023_9AGAR|nr:glycoside hydrolase family 95 protein [Gymnopus androsaceus JB14]
MKLKTLTASTILPVAVISSSTPPAAFPASGNGLWYNTTGDVTGTLWSTTFLPIGNGYLAAMTPGGMEIEALQLNIESLWAGGPFQDPTYNGGNKLPNETTATHLALEGIRASIFANATGETEDVYPLTSPFPFYGSYVGAGYLITTMNVSSPATDFARWLDLDEGVARTTWTQSSSTFIRETFCSHPTEACVQFLNTSSNATLPGVTYAFSVLDSLLPTPPNITCQDSSTLKLRGFASEPGMLYEILAQVQSTGGLVSCNALDSTNATISVTGATETWISWVGGTEYSMDAGDEASNFSFQGPDPHEALVSLLSSADTESYQNVLAEHIADVNDVLYSQFSLSLGQVTDSRPTDEIVTGYEYNVGNPYLEWITFNYGRYMLASSARDTPWGGDYHADINVQMNYWSAEMSNLDVTSSLWNYIEKTWAPRGATTAQLIYNISRGWVTHDEMNIFGHTGMKGGPGEGNTAEWANYPVSAVWLVRMPSSQSDVTECSLHSRWLDLWDHFDYTNDVAWWQAQGYPLLKGVASFHLDTLIPDQHFNDGTLITAPCNSPEQVPITLGCAHTQQLIWQMFNAVEKGFNASGDTDTDFLDGKHRCNFSDSLNHVRDEREQDVSVLEVPFRCWFKEPEVIAKRSQMDKGIRIGWWGQLQEWKVNLDSPTDTHRHLSHLVGLYPGYAIASYDMGIQGGLIYNDTKFNYTKDEVMDAAMTSLIHRGNGTGPDADAGWEKAWRAAAWAQLGNASEFYFELTYTLYENFAPNLFSLYDPFDPVPIFQIDANFGFPAALLNGLLQAPDVASFDIPLVITLLPALPTNWPSGHLKGARTRGGITVDLDWSDGKPETVTLTVDESPISTSRNVQVVYAGKEVGSFTTSPNFATTIQSF